MPNTQARASEAHERSVTYGIADIAQFLQETLGSRLVATVAGVSDHKAVGRWASGERTPRAEADKRLRLAFQVFQLLNSKESAHTVRAWFVGLNPQLDDESPAEAIRDGQLRDVLVAAKAYIAGG